MLTTTTDATFFRLHKWRDVISNVTSFPPPNFNLRVKWKAPLNLVSSPMCWHFSNTACCRAFGCLLHHLLSSRPFWPPFSVLAILGFYPFLTWKNLPLTPSSPSFLFTFLLPEYLVVRLEFVRLASQFVCWETTLMTRIQGDTVVLST